MRLFHASSAALRVLSCGVKTFSRSVGRQYYWTQQQSCNASERHEGCEGVMCFIFSFTAIKFASPLLGMFWACWELYLSLSRNSWETTVPALMKGNKIHTSAPLRINNYHVISCLLNLNKNRRAQTAISDVTLSYEMYYFLTWTRSRQPVWLQEVPESPQWKNNQTHKPCRLKRKMAVFSLPFLYQLNTEHNKC